MDEEFLRGKNPAVTDDDDDPIDIEQTLRTFGDLVEQSKGRINLTMMSGQIFYEAADKIKELQADATKWRTAYESYLRNEQVKDARRG